MKTSKETNISLKHSTEKPAVIKNIAKFSVIKNISKFQSKFSNMSVKDVNKSLVTAKSLCRKN